MEKSSPQPRRRWVIPDYDDAVTPIAADLTTSQHCHTNGFEKPSPNLTDENQPPFCGAGLSLHQVTQKLRELLEMKGRQDIMSTELSVVLDKISSKSLSSVSTADFTNKQHGDVAGVLEHMLRKVGGELERILVSQNGQLAKLKSTLKEHLKREEWLSSRASVLETLAAGTEEELKILSSQLSKMKIEKSKAEEDIKKQNALMQSIVEEKKACDVLIEDLKKQLDLVQLTNKEHCKQLEAEKQDLEQKLQTKLDEQEVILKESQKRVKELEAVIAAEVEGIKKKDEKYKSFVSLQHELFQDVKRSLYTMKHGVVFLQEACEKDLDNLEEQLQGLVNAALGYHKVLAENRLLYNEVQDLKGNIRVYCRVRPFLPGQGGKPSTVEYVGENGDILISNPLKQQGKDLHKLFSFNKVFRPSATQEEVFMDTQPLIRSVLDGYNVCIFAYGQTGSGKTYTMSGPSSLSQRDWGVNYRALDDLFQLSQSRKDVISYEVGVQMIEIYNEQVRDLLFINTTNRRLEIRNSSQLNGVNVPNATMLPVNSTADVFKLMKIGQQNRAIGATALNEHSSRSHSVLTVHVRGMELATGAVLHGCLHLVDLAGSERVDRSEATGDRLKEAQHINKSLSALGDVVSALAQKSGHVPYRNSKLTQLLQDSLGGQAKTLMFVHISPDLESYGETLSTLKFAERVASVELGAARTNKESRELRDLKEQVALLKELVSKKDIEIEHLQAGKVSNERISGSEKMKVRVAGNASAFRRQTMDVTGQKEKRLVGRLFLDSAQQQDAKTAVVSIESANTKEPQDGGGKEDARMGTSKNMVKDTDGGIRPWRQKGGPDHQAEELEAVSEEWRHIIRQSQVHPHIPGGANNQQAAPDSVISFPNMRSVMEKETYLQAMSLRETISAASQSEAAEES